MHFRSIIGAVAPILGALIGGPIGGVAMKILSNPLLGSEGGTEQAITKAIKHADPAKLLELNMRAKELQEK